MNPPLVFALGWLAALMLGVHAGAAVPEGFGLAVIGLTLWSLGYLYYRTCRRWPAFGWLALGFIAGLFGGGYHSHATYVVEREYDDVECDNYGGDCDNCDN